MSIEIAKEKSGTHDMPYGLANIDLPLQPVKVATFKSFSKGVVRPSQCFIRFHRMRSSDRWQRNSLELLSVTKFNRPR